MPFSCAHLASRNSGELVSKMIFETPQFLTQGLQTNQNHLFREIHNNHVFIKISSITIRYSFNNSISYSCWFAHKQKFPGISIVFGTFIQKILHLSPMVIMKYIPISNHHLYYLCPFMLSWSFHGQGILPYAFQIFFGFFRYLNIFYIDLVTLYLSCKIHVFYVFDKNDFCIIINLLFLH